MNNVMSLLNNVLSQEDTEAWAILLPSPLHPDPSTTTRHTKSRAQTTLTVLHLSNLQWWVCRPHQSSRPCSHPPEQGRQLCLLTRKIVSSTHIMKAGFSKSDHCQQWLKQKQLIIILYLICLHYLSATSKVPSQEELFPPEVGGEGGDSVGDSDEGSDSEVELETKVHTNVRNHREGPY